MEMFGVLTCVTFLIFLFGKGETLKCYQCTKLTASGNYAGDATAQAMVTSMLAANNDKCNLDGDEFAKDASSLSSSCGSTSSGYERRCMKAKNAKMSFKFNGKDITIEGNSRMCQTVKTSDNVANDCNAADIIKKQMGGTQGMSDLTVSGTACICNSDNCNGSQAVIASGLLIMVAIVLAKFF